MLLNSGASFFLSSYQLRINIFFVCVCVCDLICCTKITCAVADTDSRHQDGVDVYVNISSRKLKLLFEMVPGIKTSNFVGEIFRAIEGNNKKNIFYTAMCSVFQL
jgi:hypothetical protein